MQSNTVKSVQNSTLGRQDNLYIGECINEEKACLWAWISGMQLEKHECATWKTKNAHVLH